MESYVPATRHPWPCLWFVLPWLVLYEVGVVLCSDGNPELYRTGADAWVRWSLRSLNVHATYAPPLLLCLIFAGWNYARKTDRPGDVIGTWLGMSVESIGFGLLLLGIGKLQGPWISQPNVLLGLPNLNVDPQTSERFGRVVSFVGAGIYEECIFRLMIYTILLYILDCGNLAQFVTIPIAIVLSAVIFSAAHHMGPFGEPYNPHLFLFRFQAGVFFALLYQLRGIGIAVGTHAFYDVLVGSALV